MRNYSIYILLIMVFSFSILHSQVKKVNQNNLSVSLEGGFTVAKTDYRNSIPGSVVRGTLEYILYSSEGHLIGFRFSGGGQNIHGRDNRKQFNSFRTGMNFIGGGGLYSYSFNNRYYPYVFAGLSQLWFDIDLNGIEEGKINSGKLNSLSYDVELGLKIAISNNVAFNISSSINFLNNDKLDNTAIGLNNDLYIKGMAGFSFSLFNSSDSDNDGIPDDKDACPQSPEDFDGFEDHDGCPDFDNDKDGILDKTDKCPNLAEDFDGFDDYDGCPDVDNDNDGILDEDDNCKNAAEDFDGFEDEDGCPDFDNDNDNIPDENDKCPELPEDLDGFEDNDGCPDIDNDKDGILDVNDKCPDQPETYNRYQDEDGCPDTAPKAEMQQQYIPPKEIEKSIPEKTADESLLTDEFIIHGVQTFDREKSEIKTEAYGNLNRIAEMIKKNPGSKWRIEGHMDNSLPKEKSIEISRKRAQSILKYFVSKGIPASRFEVVGMGDKSPIESNEKVYGRMKNRRIEVKRIR